MRSASVLAALVALAAVVAACGAPAPTAASSTAPIGAVGPTRICETVQMANPPSSSCTQVIGQVFLALGRDAAAVNSAWFRPGHPCPLNARCAASLPGTAYVVVRLEGGAVGIFLVTLAGDEIAVDAAVEPTFDIWPPSGQATPAVGRPDVGSGAPAEVAGRDALPLCGEERVGVLDGRAARSCFLGAVQDGRPAELVSRSVDLAGDRVVEVYRFAGRGPVLVYRSSSPAGPGWVRSDCAIGPAFDDAQIFVVGECLSTELS